jgi:hypothetical protein
MIRHQLILIGLRSSIYIAILVFFLACILGYASSLAIETLIQKAVIAGSLFGLTSFVMIKMLVKFVPENIGVENKKEINDENKDETK